MSVTGTRETRYELSRFILGLEDLDPNLKLQEAYNELEEALYELGRANRRRSITQPEETSMLAIGKALGALAGHVLLEISGRDIAEAVDEWEEKHDLDVLMTEMTNSEFCELCNHIAEFLSRPPALSEKGGEDREAEDGV